MKECSVTSLFFKIASESSNTKSPFKLNMNGSDDEIMRISNFDVVLCNPIDIKLVRVIVIKLLITFCNKTKQKSYTFYVYIFLTI